MNPSAATPVFDPLVRLTHLCFIVGVPAAWFTRHARGNWHEWIGYAVLAALLIRLIWGFVGWGFAGSRHARFAEFLRGPRTTSQYARQVWRGEAPRHLGHNPLGAWMIAALLSTLLVISVTGWMFTTDRWFGIGWVIATHEYATWVLFVLIPIHVLGVLHASWHQRENLIVSMVHGRKRPNAAADVSTHETPSP